MATEWKTWNGQREIHREDEVFIRYRNGIEKGPVKANSRRWKWRDDLCDWDITAYQKVRADG